jgi:Thoeris protein ThsA, Macro domain
MIKAQLYNLRFLSYRKALEGGLATLGTIWLLYKIANEANIPASSILIENVGWWFLFALIYGLVRGWNPTSVSCKLVKRDITITIKVGSLFDQSTSYVVSANSTFDTSLEGKIISNDSIQGKYTGKYFKSNIDDLDRMLGDSLNRNVHCALTDVDKPYGKLKKYRIGTVASVNAHERTAYFVAISHLNREKIAESDLDYILESLPKLWKYISTNGDSIPVSIPILGTARSRVSTNRQFMIREIIKSFVIASKDKRFCDHLYIMISPKDFAEHKVNLTEIGRFLENECLYTYEHTETKSGGTAI